MLRRQDERAPRSVLRPQTIVNGVIILLVLQLIAERKHATRWLNCDQSGDNRNSIYADRNQCRIITIHGATSSLTIRLNGSRINEINFLSTLVLFCFCQR